MYIQYWYSKSGIPRVIRIDILLFHKKTNLFTSNGSGLIYLNEMSVYDDGDGGSETYVL